jgi:hypothetical protein
MSIFELCLCALVSFPLIGVGVYGLKHGFSLFVTREQLWKDLVKWRVFGDSEPPAQILAEIKQSWCYLRSMIAIGGGVGVIMTGICMVAISLVVTGTVDGGDSGDSMLFSVLLYSSFFMGFGMGGIFAVWRLRKAAKRRVTYADLRQRRLSDYRNGLLRWIPLVVMAATIALSCFFLPHLSTLRFLQSDETVVDIPNRLWMLGIVPGAMVVITIVAEFLMARLARLSRLVITSDLTISQRVDDMLRATVIVVVQAYALAAVVFLGLLQAGLVMRSLWASGYWQLGNRPYSVITSVFDLLLLLTLIIGGVLTAIGGRPGGKVSDGPWQAQQIKQLNGK